MFLNSKITLNTLALYVENLVNIIIGILTIYYLSRYLGPEAFGKFNFVVSFILLFLGISEFGIGQITTREVAKFPDKKDKLMGMAMLLKIIFSGLSMIACGLVFFLGGFDRSLTVGLIIYSSRLLFSPISLSMVFYRTELNNHLSALINISLKCLYLFLICLAVFFKLPLLFILSCLAFSETMTDIVRCFLLKDKIGYNLDFDFRELKVLFMEFWPLGLSIICYTFYMRFSMVFLPKIVDYYQIGIYSAADKMIEGLFFIPQNLSTVLFPLFAMYSIKESDKGIMILLKSVNCLGAVAGLLFFLMFLYSKEFVMILFGHQFIGCEELVQILSFQVLFVFVSIPLSQYLIAVGKQKVNLAFDILAVIINVVLFVICTPKWGIRGTAFAVLATKAFLTSGTYFYFRYGLRIRINLLPAFYSLLLIISMFGLLRLIGSLYDLSAIIPTLILYVLMLIKFKLVNLEDFVFT